MPDRYRLNFDLKKYWWKVILEKNTSLFPHFLIHIKTRQVGAIQKICTLQEEGKIDPKAYKSVRGGGSESLSVPTLFEKSPLIVAFPLLILWLILPVVVIWDNTSARPTYAMMSISSYLSISILTWICGSDVIGILIWNVSTDVNLSYAQNKKLRKDTCFFIVGKGERKMKAYVCFFDGDLTKSLQKRTRGGRG